MGRPDLSDIGDTLREERVRRGQTPAEVAREVGAPKATLHALEAGTVSLDDAHNRAYLRMYARHLGLDAEALLRDLHEAPDAAPPEVALPARPAGAALDARPARFAEPVEETESFFWASDDNGNWTSDDNGNGHAGNTTHATNGVAALGTLGRWRPPAMPPVADKARQLLILAALGVLSAVVVATAVVLLAGGDEEGSTVTLTSPPAAEDPAAPGGPAGREGTASVADPDTPAGTSPQPDATEPAAREGQAATTLRPPEDTQVQILHNNASTAVILEMIDLLESFGYDVVWINGARARIERTTVYAVAGWEAEAEALAARDPRLGGVAPNERFSTDVQLHVAIGPDWIAEFAEADEGSEADAAGEG